MLATSGGAIRAYEEAIRLLSEVTRRDPEHLVERALLHTAWMHVADTRAADEPARAVEIYSKALEYTKPGWLMSAIDSQWKITYPLRKLGRHQEALAQACPSRRFNELRRMGPGQRNRSAASTRI